MPQESGTVVTIHRRPLLSPILQGYPQDIFTLPPKLRGRSHSEDKSVYCRIVQYFYNLWIVLQPFKADNPFYP